MTPAWDSEELAVASDSRRTSRYRLLQSWYRQERLRVQPGWYTPRGYNRRQLGSLLADESVATDPTLNFLGDASVVAYARSRAVEVQREKGTLEEHRLFHNMLSSMPMCFNVFGKFRALPQVDQIKLVRRLFDDRAVDVELMECEWTPRHPSSGINDRTAFDAAIVTVRADGTRSLIGVEAKYTEPFSRTRYGAADHREPDKYRHIHDACGWFESAAYEQLTASKTNQLWRNCLLAASTEVSGEFDTASVIVMAIANDPGAASAIAGVQAAAADPSRCRAVPLEDVIEASRTISGLTAWADEFNRRYLDLTPVS